MNEKITTIISYSTNDKQFLRHCIEHVKPFSQEIIVSMCSHHFDGTPISQQDLNDSMGIICEYGATIVAFPFTPDINTQRGTPYESRFWNNYQRYLAWLRIRSNPDWILWLDADEIVDTNNFMRWLSTGDIQNADSYSVSNYWYWRTPSLRAKHIESNTILSRASMLSESMFLTQPEIEREKFLVGRQQYCKRGLGGEVLIHHYSWVRNKEQMLQKVSSWSHNKDEELILRARRNIGAPSDWGWPQFVNWEFTRENPSRDFLCDHELETVQPYITL